MPTIEANGITLNYELSGNADGELLVFSNSLGTTMHMWDPQTEFFGRDYHVLRYDMRGHGASSAPAGPYTLDMLGGDVLALLDALHLDKVNFCGLSIGGAIGQWLGIHEPERLHKLVLSNTAAKIGTEEIWNQRIALVTSDGMQPLADGAIGRWFTPAFRATGNPLVERMRQMLLATSVAGYAGACAALRDSDLRDSINLIEVPVCIIVGEQDPVTTYEDGEFLHDRIAGSQMHVLPAAHISSGEQPQLFDDTVLEFLHGGAFV